MIIIKEFENQLRKNIEDDDINGSISAAILHKDTTIWAQAFGPANRSTDRWADAATIYRVASITKSFTAFLMMLMVQDAAIELDQPVDEHLPEIQELESYSDFTRITYRQLASHTAGLIREPALEKADSGPIETWEDKVLLAIPHTSFESKPGERFSYSNIGYALLGLALARAGNAAYIELVENRICKPLDMKDSFFMMPEHKRETLAQGLGGGPFGDAELDLEGPQKEHSGRGYKVPNGGLYSTTVDLCKFMMANMGYSDLLERKYLQCMQTRHSLEASYHGYGLGFELYQDSTFKFAGHSGGMWGYSSCMTFETTSEFGVVLLRNYSWGTTSWEIGPKVLLRKLLDQEKPLDRS